MDVRLFDLVVDEYGNYYSVQNVSDEGEIEIINEIIRLSMNERYMFNDESWVGEIKEKYNEKPVGLPIFNALWSEIKMAQEKGRIYKLDDLMGKYKVTFIVFRELK